MRNLLKRMFVEDVYAHCDIPCGIYDTKPSMIAAQTVLKMVQKINELLETDDYKAGSINSKNSLTRYILVKEEHARKCKEEILILWTDFFKPEDLATFPELHDKVWKAAKLVSKNKQEVNIESANELVQAVKEIGDMFDKISEMRAAHK